MATWWSKWLHALPALMHPKHAVRQALHAAQRDRVKVSLEMPNGTEAAHLITVIEQIRNEDVVIAQPSIGGQIFPLAFGEKIRMSFTINDVHYAGETRCLGRIKVRAGGAPRAAAIESMIFAYRLTLPDSLTKQEHRASPRVKLFESPIEAQLYSPVEGSGMMIGRLLDLNMTGAKVGTLIRASWLAPGKSAFLKIMLPEPVGLLDELVDVARLEEAEPGQEQVIGIKFRRRIEGLEEFIRANQATISEPRRKSA